MADPLVIALRMHRCDKATFLRPAMYSHPGLCTVSKQASKPSLLLPAWYLWPLLSRFILYFQYGECHSYLRSGCNSMQNLQQMREADCRHRVGRGGCGFLLVGQYC